MVPNTKGNSIIEIIVVIVILTIGLTGGYAIVSRGENLARTTEKRIQAINIAREGLEAVQNIRDTNWLLLSSDYKNCWNVSDYSSNCIGTGSGKIANGTYILTQNIDNRWTLTTYTTNSGVYLDTTNNLPVQGVNYLSKCTPTVQANCVTAFTRTIDITNPSDTEMDITSKVTWSDASSTQPHIIKLSTTLTNWKINK